MVLKWLMSCRLVLSLFFCTPTCHSWRPCSGLWQQIMKRICRQCCGRYDWRDLCHSLQIALQSVTFAKAGQGGRLRRPFIRKWHSSLWWAPSSHLFFIFVTRPVNTPHSASGVCAGGVWANVKWTIKKRSELVIFLCPGLFSQNVSRVIPLHISSDPSCVSVYRSRGPFFSDTSSVAYAALHTEASFC